MEDKITHIPTDLTDNLTEYELCSLRNSLASLKKKVDTSIKSQHYAEISASVDIRDMRQKVDRAAQFQKESKWIEGPESIINRTKQLPLGNFSVKEEYKGISPFVVFLIPQIHKVNDSYSQDAILSQNNIKELLPILENNNLSRVNLLEGSDIEHPDYHSSEKDFSYQGLDTIRAGNHVLYDSHLHDKFLSFSAESNEEVLESEKIIVDNLDYIKIYIKIAIEENIQVITSRYLESLDKHLKHTSPNTVVELATKIFGEDFQIPPTQASIEKVTEYAKSNKILSSDDHLIRRNRQIMSNILLHSENVPANAFSLILGFGHFEADFMKGSENTMQSMLKEQGISYVLLEDKTNPFSNK